MNEDQARQYQYKYITCPYCGSYDIETRPMDLEGNMGFQDVECYACGKKWNDVYKLIGVDEYRFDELKPEVNLNNWLAEDDDE